MFSGQRALELCSANKLPQVIGCEESAIGTRSLPVNWGPSRKLAGGEV